jgi:hypothetical protein
MRMGVSQEISISVDKNIESPTYGLISILGLSQETLDELAKEELADKNWTIFFNVRVVDASQPMMGAYEIASEAITFQPRFLPDPNISYEVSFSSNGLKTLFPKTRETQEFSATVSFDEAFKSPKVEAVFPTSQLLPANMLRLYVQFSSPMGLKNPYEYIRIVREDNVGIKEPFVEMEEGLWSRDRTRLTLLIHPGRIKRGVGPNITQGEVFEEGQSYRLEISDEWGLDSDHVKQFKITESVRSTIDLKEWEIMAPNSESSEILTIKTKKMLDKAIGERMVSVIDENGSQIKGLFHYNSVNMTLSFIPEQKWNATRYSILVNPRLEDVCGNTPMSEFDVEGNRKTVGGQLLELSFEPRE